MRSVELFAGAGGLAIGMTRAGFRHAAVIERDHEACETFRENQEHHSSAVEDWPLHEEDARYFRYASLQSDVDLVSGGPPCQPFSMAGRHRAQSDSRDMFPEAVRAVRELRPRAFVFENVKGLTRQSFGRYFSYLQLQLQYPEIERRRGESWRQHRVRLERHHTANRYAATYNVVYDVLNAADFGVPQRRERVFIVGFRSDLGAAWSFPEPTHSEDALLAAKWVTGEYWERHKVPGRWRPELSGAVAQRVWRLKAESPREGRLPWRTVLDAIGGLPAPQRNGDVVLANHVLRPGARAYAGHTGSLLDEPAKVIKAGSHGVPGGENMVVLRNRDVRYFTIREVARIQTFPDDYVFRGHWGNTIRQLGNAVPVRLAEIIGKSVAESLLLARK